MKYRPLRDRLLLSKLPPLHPSRILSYHGEQQSSRDSMVRMQVHALGRGVVEEDIQVGTVVYVASKALLNLVRYRDDGDMRYWLLHESDIDAVELCE